MKKKKNLFYYLKKDRFIYLLMLPGLIWYLVFRYFPMLGIVIAFEDYKPFWGIEGIFTSNWVGFKHFIKFFQSPYFFRLMKNTLLLSIYTLVWSFPIAIILALFINELKCKIFQKTVQTVSYLPHFLSTVIVCGMIRTLVSVDGGLVNAIVKFFGGEAMPFLGMPEYFRTIYTVSEVWRASAGTASYLSQRWPPSTRSSMRLPWWTVHGVLKRMWHITIPGIMPVITIMLILKVGNILNLGYEKVLLLYSPQVYSTADVISTYVYREGVVNQNYSFATAVNLFTSVISLILVLGTNKITKKLGQEGIW